MDALKPWKFTQIVRKPLIAQGVELHSLFDERLLSTHRIDDVVAPDVGTLRLTISGQAPS